MSPKYHLRVAAALLIACLPFVSGCQSVTPLPAVDHVDLARFAVLELPHHLVGSALNKEKA